MFFSRSLEVLASRMQCQGNASQVLRAADREH